MRWQVINALQVTKNDTVRPWAERSRKPLCHSAQKPHIHSTHWPAACWQMYIDYPILLAGLRNMHNPGKRFSHWYSATTKLLNFGIVNAGDRIRRCFGVFRKIMKYTTSWLTKSSNLTRGTYVWMFTSSFTNYPKLIGSVWKRRW